MKTPPPHRYWTLNLLPFYSNIFSKQYPCSNPPCSLPARHKQYRVTISNLSPTSEQGTAAPNMLDPCNNQPSLSQLPHPSASQLPAINAPACATLPVPTQLRQQIIDGEYIDFGVLLSKCSYDDAGHATSTHTPATPISSSAIWMEASNIYAMVMLKEYPAKAIELLAYQSIICSASKSLPLHA